MDPKSCVRLRRHGRLLFIFVALSGCRSAEKATPWSPPPLAAATLSPVTTNLTARWGEGEVQASAPASVIQQASVCFPKHPRRDHAFALAELYYLAGTKSEAA